MHIGPYDNEPETVELMHEKAMSWIYQIRDFIMKYIFQMLVKLHRKS